MRLVHVASPTNGSRSSADGVRCNRPHRKPHLTTGTGRQQANRADVRRSGVVALPPLDHFRCAETARNRGDPHRRCHAHDGASVHVGGANRGWPVELCGAAGGAAVAHRRRRSTHAGQPRQSDFWKTVYQHPRSVVRVARPLDRVGCLRRLKRSPGIRGRRYHASYPWDVV